jgi:hypothetical protein
VVSAAASSSTSTAAAAVHGQLLGLSMGISSHTETATATATATATEAVVAVSTTQRREDKALKSVEGVYDGDEEEAFGGDIDNDDDGNGDGADETTTEDKVGFVNPMPTFPPRAWCRMSVMASTSFVQRRCVGIPL